MKRLLLLIPIAALALAFFAFGLHHHLTLDAFYASGEVFDDLYQRQPLLVIAAYFALFAFFIVNLIMGLSRIPLFTFYWVTQLGMLAGIAVYANAGTQLAEAENLSDILTPDLIGSLALLGLFPLLGKQLVRWLRRRRAPAD